MLLVLCVQQIFAYGLRDELTQAYEKSEYMRGRISRACLKT